MNDILFFIAALILTFLLLIILMPSFAIRIRDELSTGLIRMKEYFIQKEKILLSISCFLGLLAVLLGAFGTHSLKNILSAKMMETYKTANLYHFFHSIVATFLCFQLQHFDSKLLRGSIFLFLIGIFIFSGSLYLLAITGNTKLGMITPIGGSLFILAWFLLFCFSLRYNQ